MMMVEFGSQSFWLRSRLCSGVSAFASARESPLTINRRPLSA